LGERMSGGGHLLFFLEITHSVERNGTRQRVPFRPFNCKRCACCGVAAI
jgi:hypothetical protein